MRGGIAFIAALVGAALGSPSARGGETLWTDPRGDVLVRRTDPGADGALKPGATMPDLISARLSGWEPDECDPYEGEVDPSSTPDVLRIALTFAGLINPPGVLDLDGPGGLPHDPFRFGPSPVFGFLEIDVDDNPNSGGEFHPIALTRYLANVGRFGRTPVGFPSDRAVLRQGETDDDFFDGPYYERSGADFALAMCGCYDTVLVSECGDGDGQMQAGERMTVRGRFFQLMLAVEDYACFGGTQFEDGPSMKGHYDPPVDLRFTHDDEQNVTLVELIYPISMRGAAMLTGEPQQFIGSSFGGGDHYALQEALRELNFVAILADALEEQELLVLVDGWKNQAPPNFNDPGEWRVTALFGTAYDVPEPVATFAWTDTGFGEAFGDFNGDGASDYADHELVGCEIEDLDGDPVLDSDGTQNGAVGIPSFGLLFSAFDMNYSGGVDAFDSKITPPCCSDLAEPIGVLNFSDVLAFLDGFMSMSDVVDCAEPIGVLNFSDVLEFMTSFGGGCY